MRKASHEDQDIKEPPCLLMEKNLIHRLIVVDKNTDWLELSRSVTLQQRSKSKQSQDPFSVSGGCMILIEQAVGRCDREEQEQNDDY